MAEDIAQKLQPIIISDVLEDISDGDNICEDIQDQDTSQLDESDLHSDGLINLCTSFRDLSHFDRLTRSSKKLRICCTKEDKVIRRPMIQTTADDSRPPDYHYGHTTTIFYDNPFDSRLFEGLSKALKFCLVGSPAVSCDSNIFIKRENTIKLIENNLLGYRLFIMVPALPTPSPPRHTDMKFSDKTPTSSILNSWLLLKEVITISEDILDKLAPCKLQHIWSRDKPTHSSTSVNSDPAFHINTSRTLQTESGFSGSAVSLQPKCSSKDDKMETLSTATSLGDDLSDGSPHCHKKKSNQRCAVTNSHSKNASLAVGHVSTLYTIDLRAQSPVRKVKRLESDKDMMDESGYLSSQQMTGSADAISYISEEDETSRAAKETSMNPLAAPFVYKQSPSCEERIMVDQLRVNRSFGVDEPIENQYCSNFFPSLPTPHFFQANNNQSAHSNQMQRIPNQMKPVFDSTNIYQNYQLPLNLPPNNNQPQISINVSNPKQSQQMFVSAPVAPTAPPPNQQPPVFINTTVPTRCTWVPAQSVLVRHVMPPPNILPQVPSQMLMQGGNQIPLYVMPSQNTKLSLPPPPNQQYGNGCRPMMPPNYMPPVNQAGHDSMNNNQNNCVHPQVQKKLIKSALEIMKCRPSTSSRIQQTASRQ